MDCHCQPLDKINKSLFLFCLLCSHITPLLNALCTCILLFIPTYQSVLVVQLNNMAVYDWSSVFYRFGVSPSLKVLPHRGRLVTAEKACTVRNKDRQQAHVFK